jgi:hypothetical protein
MGVPGRVLRCQCPGAYMKLYPNYPVMIALGLSSGLHNPDLDNIYVLQFYVEIGQNMWYPENPSTVHVQYIR